MADGLLRACPRLRILATSREPLGVPGEVTWRVPSLPFPADPPQVSPGDLGRFEAVRLFAERARLARPRFTLTEDNAAAVAEICARLDGIPLAIELAAARARVFSAAQIAAGLQDRFRLLTGGARTAVPRQQTLEASVAWSYDLLAEPERAVLRQLSVFSGGFTLEAAGAVAIGAGQPEAVLPLVSSLADKSLIVAAEDDTGDRFRMLETIGDYAAARLLEAGEAAGAQARHFGFFARAVDRRPGEDEDSYCERLRADYDNIRVALGWASRQDAPELLLGLATRLVVFWSASTHLAEAVQWLRSATERGRDAEPGLRARALGALTQIASLTLDLPLAFAAGTEGLAVLRQLGDNEGIVMTLTSLGSSAIQTGEPEAFRPYLDEAIALAEETGDQRALAYALAVRGRVANSFAADRPAGREALRRSIEVARQCGARHVEGIALGNLGVLSALDGRPRDAIPLLTEALPLLREAGDVYFLSLTLIGLVQSLSLRGDYDAALVPCRELDSISGQLGAAQLYFAPCARGFAGYLRGDWPEAIRAFREQLTFFSPVRMGGMWVGHLAWAEFLAGQQETARGRLDEFIASSDPARTSLALPWAVRAVIARASGDHERAAELAQQAVAAAPDDPFGQSTVLECLAVLAAVQADGDQHELAVRLAAAPGGLRGRRGDAAAAVGARAHRSGAADLPGGTRRRPLRLGLVTRSGPGPRRRGRLRHPRPRAPVTACAGLGEPHADRARRGPGGGRRTVQPADRRPYVHLPAYRHHAPDQHLPQARHLVPGRARRPSRPPRRSPDPVLKRSWADAPRAGSRSGSYPCSMRSRLPAGSRTAASRTPQGCLAGSSSTSTPGAVAILSKVVSRSSARKWTGYSSPLARMAARASPSSWERPACGCDSTIAISGWLSVTRVIQRKPPRETSLRTFSPRVSR